MNKSLIPLVLLALMGFGCTAEPGPLLASEPVAAGISVLRHSSSRAIAEASVDADGRLTARTTGAEGWLTYELDVPETGRYRVELDVQAAQPTVVWLEDYIENEDGRTYDLTGPMPCVEGAQTLTREGCPLGAGVHAMRLHFSAGVASFADLRLTMMRPHAPTPRTLEQRTDGERWELVWSDEFGGTGLPDPEIWTADIGDWGWGNREEQYYTEGRVENARQENGHLIIEARRGDMGKRWTSARLTTRGKLSFLYGRIEFRAKVPARDGTWAAGWLLGDAYRDEVSWPYCGEIDVLEGVGREIDDATGTGVNHASCHTRAFYFKQGNHISSTIDVEDMSGSFHVYAVEWTPEEVRCYIDGEHYYTYDERANELAWPFDEPQNLILNLAMGGGMGGAIDPAARTEQYVIDYVRVFEKR